MHKREILNNIYVLTFDSQYDVASTFLRFQEFYESVEFKGKYFTLNEFEKWYSKKFGQFSYYDDWSGFNIPSHILKPFYEGKFNPLSCKELELLNEFENINDDFYIIGISDDNNLNHEIAHGLFYTNELYKKEITNILSKYNMSEFKENLNKLGYHKDVLDDEVHAYAIDECLLLPYTLSYDIKTVFKKYKGE